MIEIVRANMKLTDKEDRLFYSLSHIEKLVKADIEKANRWFGYYQKVGEDKGFWTLKDVIQWVKDEKGLNPIPEKYFIFSIHCYGKTDLNDIIGTYLIHAKNISDIVYLVESYQLKINYTTRNVTITFCQEIPEHDYHKYADIFACLDITLEEAEQIRKANRPNDK